MRQIADDVWLFGESVDLIVVVQTLDLASCSVVVFEAGDIAFGVFLL